MKQVQIEPVGEVSRPTQRFNFFRMFKEGFAQMTLGRVLWTLVIIKLIIMFLILRPFLFPNYLNSKFDDNQSKANYVNEQLIEKAGTLH